MRWRRRPLFRTSRGLVVLLAAVALGTVAVLAWREAAPRPGHPAEGPGSSEGPCVAATRSRPSGPEPVREPELPDGHMVDLRGIALHGQQDTASRDPVLKPLNLAVRSRARSLCVWGGTIIGLHHRDLPWQHLKLDPGGGDHPAVRIGVEDWALVDGIRIDNMMNGFRPDGDDLIIRNAFLRHIRDDCVENDSLHRIQVVDSLFDGCYTGFSARPEAGSPLWDAGRDTSPMMLDGVLVRLAPMQGGFRVPPRDQSYGQLFKWSDVSGPLVVRNSVILVEASHHPTRRLLDWPADTHAAGTTLVWTGPGPYPGRLPDSGVSVTRDRTVWEQARAEWMDRHRCRSFDDCDEAQTLAPLPEGTRDQRPGPGSGPGR